MTYKKIEVGRKHETIGGWVAEIIWLCKNDINGGFYAIHRPGADDESVPIYHHGDGTAHSLLSVNEPPTFLEGHPADIILPTKSTNC